MQILPRTAQLPSANMNSSFEVLLLLLVHVAAAVEDENFDHLRLIVDAGVTTAAAGIAVTAVFVVMTILTGTTPIKKIQCL